MHVLSSPWDSEKRNFDLMSGTCEEIDNKADFDFDFESSDRGNLSL